MVDCRIKHKNKLVSNESLFIVGANFSYATLYMTAACDFITRKLWAIKVLLITLTILLLAFWGCLFILFRKSL